MRFLCAAAAFLVLSSASARADIVGNTFQVTQATNGVSTGITNTIVVPGANQGSQGNTHYSLTGTQLIFTFVFNQGLSTAFTFTDVTGPTGIASITFDPSTSIANPTFTATPSMTANSISVDLAGAISASDKIVYDFNYTPTAVTPEPSSLMLLGTGLLGAIGVARRRFV